MIAQFLNRKLFPDRQFYAPIDAKVLEHYHVHRKLGFYGIELGTSEGIKTFSDSVLLSLAPQALQSG